MFASPESIVSDEYQSLVESAAKCVLAIDEAHCLPKW